jgi:hypothetical protein
MSLSVVNFELEAPFTTPQLMLGPLIEGTYQVYGLALLSSDSEFFLGVNDTLTPASGVPVFDMPVLTLYSGDHNNLEVWIVANFAGSGTFPINLLVSFSNA